MIAAVALVTPPLELVSPLCASIHIRPWPENAIDFCRLLFSQAASMSSPPCPTFLFPLSFLGVASFSLAVRSPSEATLGWAGLMVVFRAIGHTLGMKLWF